MNRVLLSALCGFAVLGAVPLRAEACWPWGASFSYGAYCGPVCYPGYYCPPWYSCSPPVVYSAPAAPAQPAEPAPSGPTTTLSVVAPPEATVFVNDVRLPLRDGRFSFDVPNLEAGRRYAYQFRIETPGDREPRIERREITFRAGELTRVDLRFRAPMPTPVARN